MPSRANAGRASVVATLIALGLTSCVRRFPADAGGDRAVLAGIPVVFGAGPPAPQGTRVKWDFGDGESADGLPVNHAFQLPGKYQVVMTVTDASGERRAKAVLAVERRPPMAAVPPGASFAITFDHFIERLPVYLSLADRFGGSDRARTALGIAETALGFDVARPEMALAAGIDPDKGFAIVIFNEEPAATYLAIGLANEAKAAVTARQTAERFSGASLRTEPDGSVSVKTDQGQVQYIIDRGYLVLRSASTPPEANPGFPAFRSAPPTGLAGSASFQRARAHLGVGDVQVWVAPSALFDSSGPVVNPTTQAIRSGLLGLAAAGSVDEHAAEFRIWTGVEGPAAEQGLREVFTSAHPSKGQWGQLATHAPAGAAGYLSLDAAPEQITELVLGAPSGARRDRVAQALRDRTGLELDSLLLLFDGDLKAALYFETAEFYRALVSGKEPLLATGLIFALGVRDGPSAEKELVRAFTSRGFRPDVSRGPQGATYEVEFGESRAAAARRGQTLLLALGPELLRKTLSSEEAQRRLDPELRSVLPAAAFDRGHQIFYVDVARIVDAIRSPPNLSGLDPMHTALMKALVGTTVEPLGPIQDIYVDLWPETGGIAGEARVRLR
jgi:hypothetical protein